MILFNNYLEGSLSSAFLQKIEGVRDCTVDKKQIIEDLRDRCVLGQASYVQAPLQVVDASKVSCLKALGHYFRAPLHRLAMQTVLAASLDSERRRQWLDDLRWQQGKALLDRNIAVFRIALQDDEGIKYDGVLSGRLEDMIAGRLVLRLGGNAEPYETSFEGQTLLHSESGFATVQINPPAVGRSQGKPLASTMAEAARLGILFVEAISKQYQQQRQNQKAKIVLKGFSLGAGALAEAMASHCFKTEDANYMVMSINTFGRLSDVPAGMVSQFVRQPILRKVCHTVCSIANGIFRVLGVEMDGVRTAQRLSELGIPQIVIQACYQCEGKMKVLDDGIIAGRVALLTRLLENNIMHKKIVIPNISFSEKMVRRQEGSGNPKFLHCDIDDEIVVNLLDNFDEIVKQERVDLEFPTNC